MAKIESTLTAGQARIAEALFNREYHVTLGRRAGTPTTRAVPIADMPENAILKMFVYGVQRTFNDAVGGKDTMLDDKVKAVEDMIANFLKGQVGRVPTDGGDPFENECLAVARAYAKKGTAKEAWVEFEKKSDDDQEAAIRAIYENAAYKSAIETEATANIAARQAKRDAKAALAGTLGSIKL